MSYYVITRGTSVIGVTKENAIAFNLPDVTLHRFEGPIPDLNVHEYDFDTDTFVRTTTETTYTKRQFLMKFTLAERVAIRASTDPVVVDIMSMLDLAEYVSIVDPATVQSIQYLASVGLLTAERAGEILT